MGAGPGILLVNPAEDAPRTAYFVLGMPVIYVWTACWFFVQTTALVIAYTKVWTDDESERTDA